MQCKKWSPPGRICSSSAISTYPAFSSNANLSPGKPPHLKVEMIIYSLQKSLSLSHTSVIQGALIAQDNFAHVGSDEMVGSAIPYFSILFHFGFSSQAMGVLVTRQWGGGSSGKSMQYSCVRWEQQHSHLQQLSNILVVGYHPFLKLCFDLTKIFPQLTLTGVIIASFMFVGNCSGPVSKTLII